MWHDEKGNFISNSSIEVIGLSYPPSIGFWRLLNPMLDIVKVIEK
jgi:hypothetical protein